MSVKLLMVSAATEGENEQVLQCREEIVQSLHDYLKGRMFVKGCAFEKALLVQTFVIHKCTSYLLYTHL